MKKLLIVPILTLLGLWGYIGYREYLISQIEISGIVTYDFEKEYTQAQQKKLEIVREEIERKKQIPDLLQDESITKFVNNKVPFNNVGYIPKSLESIDSENIIDSKGDGKLRSIANENLQKLAIAFKKDTGSKLNIVSSYRSYEYQKGIKDRGCPDNLCAKAGYSEHQSGLVVDIFSASNQYTWTHDTTLTVYFDWFTKNAHTYGFTNTYQKGLEIDGYEIEPWHWRYIGVDLASQLKEEGITLAEYYELNK